MFLARAPRIPVCHVRYFSIQSSTLSKFSTPEEYIKKKKQEQTEEHEFQSQLLNEDFKFNPKYLGKNEVNTVTNRPVPLNVELLKYKPIQLPKTHGHKVAQINYEGYDEDDLIRAGEFSARAAYYLGIPTSHVIKNKTEKRLYTVIKSPFAQAKSKENFKRTTFKRRLIAYDASPEVIDLWLSYINKHSVPGVRYTASVTTRESLSFSEELDKLSSDDMKLPQAYEGLDDTVAAKVQEILGSESFKKHL